MTAAQALPALIPQTPDADGRIVRGDLCRGEGATEEWIGGEWESVACLGCAGCRTDKYRMGERQQAQRANPFHGLPVVDDQPF